jgi:hypothetical protein
VPVATAVHREMLFPAVFTFEHGYSVLAVATVYNGIKNLYVGERHTIPEFTYIFIIIES